MKEAMRYYAIAGMQMASILVIVPVLILAYDGAVSFSNKPCLAFIWLLGTIVLGSLELFFEKREDLKRSKQATPET